MFGSSNKPASNPDVEARIVGNTLVAQFYSGETPRTWRADLTGLLSAILEVREGQPGRFRLVMKKDGGAEEEIATFNDKEKATGALRVLTGAMLDAETGGGSRRSSAAVAASGSPRGFLSGFVRFTLWVAGLFVVLFILKVVLFPVTGPGVATGGGMSPVTTVKPGAPVPADQLFGN
jgi:hypothetical protein